MREELMTNDHARGGFILRVNAGGGWIPLANGDEARLPDGRRYRVVEMVNPVTYVVEQIDTDEAMRPKSSRQNEEP